jgi:PAS domain S-box-containing protein
LSDQERAARFNYCQTVVEGATARGFDGVRVADPAAVASSLPALVWATDSSLRVTACFGCGPGVPGLAPAQLLHRFVTDVAASREEHAALSAAQRQALAGAPARWELERRGRWIELRLEPLRDGDGRVVGTAGIAVEVTERKRSELLLRESEERFRGAFEHSPVGIGIVALDGRFVRVNAALCRIGGYSEAELLGSNFADVVPAEELDLHRREVGRLLREENDRYEHEVRYRHKQGHDVWVRFTVSGIRDPGGRITHLLGQAEDISARRRAEERLRQAERLEAVGRLAGGIAHDFNNLLAVIGGFARHARESGDPRAVDRDLVEILRASEQAAAITRQLLAFGRRETYESAVVDLHDVLAETERMLRRLLGEDVELLVVPGLDAALVSIARTHLEQVVVNLVLNARDATGPGGRIEVASAYVETGEPPELAPGLPSGRYVALSVSDDGHGIEPEMLHRLFDPFFTTKEPGRGTGLGLSIVHGIVEQAGGAIAVESETGRGTTFTVYLPLATAGPAAPPVADEPERAPPAAPAREGGETVLVVEDEDALRLLLEIVLSEAGYDVLSASDGEEALAVAEASARPVRLVVTDSVMPKLGGRELAERLRAERPEIGVIQMTGYTEDDPERGGHRLPDVDVHLQKPFDSETLLRHVREVLDGATASPT